MHFCWSLFRYYLLYLLVKQYLCTCYNNRLWRQHHSMVSQHWWKQSDQIFWIQEASNLYTCSIFSDLNRMYYVAAAWPFISKSSAIIIASSSNHNNNIICACTLIFSPCSTRSVDQFLSVCVSVFFFFLIFFFSIR